MTTTPTPPSTRPRLKHVMTATAFGLVQIRNAWRMYFAAMRADHQDRDRRGWGG